MSISGEHNYNYNIYHITLTVVSTCMVSYFLNCAIMGIIIIITNGLKYLQTVLPNQGKVFINISSYILYCLDVAPCNEGVFWDSFNMHSVLGYN